MPVSGESSPDIPLGLGDERELFPWIYLTPRSSFFDLTPAGDRFLAIIPPSVDEPETTSTIVVMNWLTEMERLGRLPNGN